MEKERERKEEGKKGRGTFASVFQREKDCSQRACSRAGNARARPRIAYQFHAHLGLALMIFETIIILSPAVCASAFACN